jgi:hypothetical protein
MSAILRSIVKKADEKTEPSSGNSCKADANGHAILGITPPPPEHERVFLLGWIVSLVLVIVISVGLVLFLIPRIMG